MKNTKKQKLIFGVILLSTIMLGVFYTGVMFSTTNNLDIRTITIGENLDEGVTYSSHVCTFITRADGTEEFNGCGENTLYNDGMDIIRNALIDGSTDSLLNISLCNATTTGGESGCDTPAAAGSETYDEYFGCGLSAGDGVASIQAGNGNWTVEKTFTSTCDAQSTNVTRIQNGTDKFAGLEFTIVTLETDDQLTINWSIKVS